MKFYNLLYFFGSILIVFTSCHKQRTDLSNMPYEIQVSESLRSSLNPNTSSSPYDKYVVLNLSQSANILNRDSSYNIDLFARFSNNEQNQNMGTLTINENLNISANSNNLYEYHFTGSELSTGKALYGTNTIIDVAEPVEITPQGPSGLRKRTIMVVPKEIFPSTINLPSSQVNRSLNFPLTWNPDPNNQYGKVQIDVNYYKGLSQFNDNTMPNSIQGLSYQVDDNGSFSIPASDLARFPQNCYIEISIIRVWTVVSSNNVAYVSFVRGSTIPLLVVDNSNVFSVSISTGPSSTPYSILCSASINGGTPPFSYEWRLRLFNGTWSNVLSTNSYLNYDWGCLTATQVSEYFRLTVTDNSGNTQFGEKLVSHRCPR